MFVNKWISELEVEEINYKIILKNRYSPIVNEYQFDYEVYQGDELKFENVVSIYSKKDAETWLRQVLNCKGKRFVWTEIE